ncbi:thioredoxin family protein [Pseudalkalibacillus sp. SCS-8]|uniref:thioredoxin family protein n=1 Tax=Pseudalkalibacillus nanhaiensis TaxID=3115291 RepID=UPI0032DA9083
MKEMNELKSIDQVNAFIDEHKMAFLYISRTNCSVCHALLPQVREMLMQYATLQMGYVNADEVPDIAGHFSIFTVPVLLLFVEGKEMIRDARFVQMDRLESQLDKIYHLQE